MNNAHSGVIASLCGSSPDASHRSDKAVLGDGAAAQEPALTTRKRLQTPRAPHRANHAPIAAYARPPGHFPVNLALRFSLNAVTPSRKSARDAQSANISASICSCDSNSFSSER